MKEFTHQCVKPACNTNYKDTDPDPYYCPSCNKERLVIAKEIDSKIKPQKPRVLSPQEQELDRWKKQGGFIPLIRG
jgi:hypothetical protein